MNRRTISTSSGDDDFVPSSSQSYTSASYTTSSSKKPVKKPVKKVAAKKKKPAKKIVVKKVSAKGKKICAPGRGKNNMTKPEICAALAARNIPHKKTMNKAQLCALLAIRSDGTTFTNTSKKQVKPPKKPKVVRPVAVSRASVAKGNKVCAPGRGKNIMTKPEICAALKAKGIAHKKTMNKAQLCALLDGKKT